MNDAADPRMDQFHAAKREAHNIFRDIIEANGEKYADPREVQRDDLPEDAPAPSRRIVDKWMAGARTHPQSCQHVSDSPGVVYAAGALPGTAFCPDCIKPHMLHKYHTDQRLFGGRECDACGAYTTVGHEGILNVESVIILVSMCPACGEQAQNE